MYTHICIYIYIYIYTHSNTNTNTNINTTNDIALTSKEFAGAGAPLSM